MRIVHLLALLMALTLTRATLADPIPAPMLLWPNGAPGATGQSDEDKPALYALPADPSIATGAAMLVVPGGGFQTRVVDHEGMLIAQWLRSKGITAFVLRYRIRPIGTTADSITDAQRAIRYIRAQAAEYKISPARLGAIGFSAGAELLQLAAQTPYAAPADSKDSIDQLASQPNFLVLAYGSSNTPAGEGTPQFPPTFMFCTAEDTSHIGGMLTLYNNLRRARVPVEVHFFANGEHGVGFAHGDPVLGEWPGLMFNWIRAGGYLSEKTRVAVKGLAMLDGEPLPRGVVVFTPVDTVGAPPVAAYVFNTGPVRGQYTLPQSQGLVPGRYRVEMHQYAVRWMSNSREPFIVAYNQKARGNITDKDRLDYLNFARARNLEPSIDGNRIFKTKSPSDKEPVIVEIKAEGAEQLDFQFTSK